MSYLDIRIQELMSETEEHLLRSSQPLGWLGLVRSTFRGRLGWIVWANVIAQIACFVLAAWLAFEFFAATSEMIALKYGLSSAVLLVLAVQFKLSLTPHYHSERILRALKRVEIILLAHTDKK